MDINPATLEVIRNSLVSIAEEMGVSLVRTAYSPGVKERRDCSCSIYDADGRMTAQAEHVPLHLGVMPQAVKEILKLFPAEQMRPGDAYIINDPYLGANHLPDIIMVTPVFYRDMLFAYVGNMAHHSDVGGMRPRSMAGDSTEIFQEGIRMPGIKLAEKGEFGAHILRFILANTRTPENVEGDLNAQLAANMLACRRLGELCGKYGLDVLRGSMKLILDKSEQQMREELKKVPDCTVYGRSAVDCGDTSYPICVKAIFEGGSLTLDFTGSSPQTASPVNAAPAATQAAVKFAVKTLIAPGIQPNEGAFRAVRTILPPGIIINPVSPAPVAGSCEVSYKTVEAIFDALASLFPEQIIAGSGAGGVLSFGGYDSVQGKAYAYGEGLGGGFGASGYKDGESACKPSMSNSKDSPAEVLEMTYPIRVSGFALRPDSEGAGQYRGGFGFCRSFEMLDDNVIWSTQTTMYSLRPQGRHGGLEAETSECVVNPGKENERKLEAYGTAVLNKGDIIELRSAGGGGYGEPGRRERSLIMNDIRNGLLSVARAAEVYGYKTDSEVFLEQDYKEKGGDL
ncbi:hydantoinase B/oxoprolinase family protein [uncultured Clostridium sp.]|uniref:hydantoinase B/oxoprolinase family protein n=1 Tax=uncultured Clostridium sp. TaxID=59620 RepID=UPI0025FCAD82|nr:hydantoinase B/oxoprolinase family protein [uncultured Clostridium sp.]